MDSFYNYLINIVFNTIGSEKAVAEAKKVEQQLTLPWDTGNVNKAGAALNNIGDKAKVAGTGLGALSQDLAGFTSILKLSKNTYDEFGNVAGTVVTEKLQNQSGVMKQVTTQFDAQGKVLKTNVQDLKKASVGMSDFVNAMKRAVIVAPIWMIMRSAIQGVTSLISSQIKFLLDMEEAMARIKIVGKGTAEEFDNLKTSLISLSVVYGTSASEALDAAQIFVQQGRSVSESIVLTKAAMIGAKALGTDIKTVVDNLTAAVEGFNIPILDTTSILDKWVAVEKEFAVTAKDLADATKVAGATAHQLGVTVSSFLGDVTAVIEVTRKSGSEAARALSFIYARLLTVGKETVEQVAKIPFYLDAQGNATSALTNKLRSHADILGDLALRWEGLEKSEKLSIAKSVGSMRQMTVFNALMQNYNRAIEARITALTAAGNAERAFGIIQETTKFKLTAVASAWNDLTDSMANTGAFKVALDSWKNLLITMTMFIDKEKAWKLAVEEVNSVTLNDIKNRRSQIDSVSELISIKEKLEKAPQTGENIANLEKINTVLENIKTKFPDLEFNIKSNPEKLKAQIDNISEQLALDQIDLEVEIQFKPKQMMLEEQKKNTIEKYISKVGVAGERELQVLGNTINAINSDIEKSLNEQSTEAEKQKLAYKSQSIDKKLLADAAKLELELTGSLGFKDKERLDNQEELIKLKSQESSEIALILKEIEQTTKAESQFETEQERSIKLRELENKLLETTIATSNKLISHEVDLARIRGASSRQLFELDSALKMQLYGENAIKSSLDYRLEKEKELTREKLHQNELSSNSMKIYEIAQEEGVEAAITIAKFLNGTISFNYLREMSGAYAIFQEKFSELNKQLLAQEFFAGKSSQWGGQIIPISEKNAVNIPSAITNIEKERTALSQNITIAPSFGGITINLPKGTLDELSNLSGKKLTELLQGNPEFATLVERIAWSMTDKGK